MDDEKSDIINRFKSLVESGKIKPSNYSLLKFDMKLASKIGGFFNKWNDFIEACGYKPNKPKTIFTERKQGWSKERIKECILELESQGKQLNYAWIRENNSPLLCAATYRFNSWEDALKYCGLDPSKIVRAHAFSKEEVISQVVELHKENQNISSTYINKARPLLFRSAYKHFGNWTNLLNSLNIKKNPEKKEKISKEETIKQTLKLYSENQNICSSYIKRTNQSLLRSAKKHFGSWTNLLEALQIGKDLVDRARKFAYKWDKESVIEKIIELHNSGQRINATYVPDPLESAGRRHFGSWDAALTAAGFSVEKIKEYKGKKPTGRAKIWTKEKVIEEIKKRHEKRLSLYCIDVNNGSLYSYGRKLFGTWKKAVKAAGLVHKEKKRCFGEDVCYHLLKSFFGRRTIHKHYSNFDWVKKYCGRGTHFDFYIPAFNLLVEFQGPTHFRPVFGAEEFEKQLVRDNRKRRLTKEHKVKLLEIRYDKMLPELVSIQLKKLDVPHAFSNKKLGLCNYYLSKLSKSNCRYK